MVRKLVLFLVLLILVADLHAEEPVELSVEPQSGTKDDYFQLSVVVSGDSHSAPALTPSDDFQIVGNNTQSFANFDGREFVVKRTFSFTMLANRTGTLTTPGVRISVNGSSLEFEGLKVKVAEGSAVNEQLDKDIIVRQSLTKSEVFVGEQVLNTLEILNRVRLFELELDTPNFDGFWSDAFGKDQSGTRSYSGETYNAYRVRKVLYPLRAGELVVPVRRITTKIREQRSRPKSNPFDPFNDWPFDEMLGGGRIRTVELRSNDLKLVVKPLPAPAQAFDNWGMAVPLVGLTKLTVSYKPESIKPGESKTIKIEVESRGNLNPLKNVALPSLQNVKQYEEAPESSSRQDIDALVMKKTFSISLVPLKSGEIRIPPLELTYFDPDQGRYKSTRSDEIVFKVAGEDAVDTVATPSQVQTIAPSSTPIPRYEEQSLAERISSHVSPTLVLMIALIVWVLAAATWIVSSNRQASAPLRTIQSRLERVTDIFELGLAFRELLALQLGPQCRQAKTEELKLYLKEHVPDGDLRLRIQLFLDELDRRLYGGEAPATTDLQTLRQEALQIARIL